MVREMREHREKHTSRGVGGTYDFAVRGTLNG
jgi:hypothetical protein